MTSPITCPPETMGAMAHAIQEVAKAKGLEDGFRVISNKGVNAGQTVMHFHMHVLGGKNLGGTSSEDARPVALCLWVTYAVFSTRIPSSGSELRRRAQAARAVHVSPQAVSSAIKKLESEYRIVLLNRSAGRLFCLRRAENLRVVHARSWHKSTISKSTPNRGTVAFRPTATFVFTSPVFTGGGVFFRKLVRLV